MPAASQSRRFIHHVWRRMVVVRIAESFAVGLAIGAAAGLWIMPLAWWAQRDALPLAVTMLVLGGLGGIVRGIFSRPTRFQAATEADKQLNLHDLLGTVMTQKSVPADATNPWREAMIAMAEARCLNLRPSEVIVHRFGLRAWGSVGILSGVLLAVGILITHPQPSSAGFSNDRALDVANIPRGVSADDLSNARPAGDISINEQSQRSSQTQTIDADPSLNQTTATGKPGSSQSAGGSNGAGQGLAQTKTPTQSNPNLPDAAEPTVGHGNGEISTGAGQESTSANGPGKLGDGTAGAPSTVNSVPPWQSDTWPADSAAAQNAIRRGDVPDADADLVRDYFKRD